MASSSRIMLLAAGLATASATTRFLQNGISSGWVNPRHCGRFGGNLHLFHDSNSLLKSEFEVSPLTFERDDSLSLHIGLSGYEADEILCEEYGVICEEGGRHIPLEANSFGKDYPE
ncbi:hypothetical protein AAC387_Pa02g4385 [Persea americana]